MTQPRKKKYQRPLVCDVCVAKGDRILRDTELSWVIRLGKYRERTVPKSVSERRKDPNNPEQLALYVPYWWAQQNGLVL